MIGLNPRRYLLQTLMSPTGTEVIREPDPKILASLATWDASSGLLFVSSFFTDTCLWLLWNVNLALVRQRAINLQLKVYYFLGNVEAMRVIFVVKWQRDCNIKSLVSRLAKKLEISLNPSKTLSLDMTWMLQMKTELSLLASPFWSSSSYLSWGFEIRSGGWVVSPRE